MKKLISIGLLIGLIFGFSGCVKDNTSLNTPKVKTNDEIKLVQNEQIKEIPIPYVKESKFIKILVLPFENSENDIDYGGYLETKLESSKFIFDDNVKNKIIEEDIIGGI
ncbi:hypothetical protein H0A43_00050 [Arcobacter lanthieri]|uniref:hypothetical protein n=1 Tax=Aliarcobacter lanthieri TaxID=1355374 RepID=UPI0019239C25|nr:hypothetical protein [Aliarcobacter lanthieri]MBL3518863.1 hypothetical protein [Aliarcobacter lanthieri]